MAVEILVADDDPLVGNLTRDLLIDAGYRTEWVQDSNLVLPAVREHRPRLVVLDILMPGVDGLTLLHEIKNDPALSGTRVIVVSAKSFAPEIDRAKEYGAEAFIQKPYDLKGFASQVAALIGAPEKPAEAKAGGRPAVRVRVWGDPAPDSTPCLAVEALDRLFILDAGKGIIPLGREILREGRHREIWLLLSHFHPDHVSGLGLFPCLRAEGLRIHVAGPKEPRQDLQAVLREAILRSYAENPEPVKATLELHHLREDLYELAPGLRLSPFYANHPGTTLGFLLELAGRRIVYSPDGEVYGESASALQDYDEKLGRIALKADLLAHDARWRDEDYAKHRNEGHSSVGNAAAFAAEYQAQRLLLFHLDPSYTAQDAAAIEQRARAALAERGAEIPCRAARDGVVLEF